MLTRLSIRDIVIIDALDLDFSAGFSVLTGETGAGKSILLDAFSLALGGRGDASLVRHGAERGQVTAVFEPSANTPVDAILSDHGLEPEGTLILRRVQSSDGRTKAYINDQPVGAALLKAVGQQLVEIHGQHDERAFLDASIHRGLVDVYGGLAKPSQAVRKAHQGRSDARAALTNAEAEIAQLRQEAEFLNHTASELDKLSPQPGEEAELAAKRQSLMSAEKIAGDLNDALDAVAGNGAPTAEIAAVLRKFERRGEEAGAFGPPVLLALSQALDALDGARETIEQTLRSAQFDPRDLEQTEERLFALRGLARKHAVQVDDLPGLQDRLHEKLRLLEQGEASLARLREALTAAELDYQKTAEILSKGRSQASVALMKAVNAELPALKLERAEFIVAHEVVPPEQGNADGIDQMVFHVRTNPGSAPGPLMKVASGGELARFLLAVKVALAGRGGAPTLVFDEIDTAVSGAVSESIGARLQKLSSDAQVLSVTHSPQVAARAHGHFLVSKQGDATSVLTQIRVLDPQSRREEIARMLAGSTITDEARAAAERLMAEAQG